MQHHSTWRSNAGKEEEREGEKEIGDREGRKEKRRWGLKKKKVWFLLVVS